MRHSLQYAHSLNPASRIVTHARELPRALICRHASHWRIHTVFAVWALSNARQASARRQRHRGAPPAAVVPVVDYVEERAGSSFLLCLVCLSKGPLVECLFGTLYVPAAYGVSTTERCAVARLGKHERVTVHGYRGRLRRGGSAWRWGSLLAHEDVVDGAGWMSLSLGVLAVLSMSCCCCFAVRLSSEFGFAERE